MPDVIGIGFQRCASTWLHTCLSEHPSVGKTPSGIHYFSDHLEKGDDWYIRQFSAFADKQVILDFSVSYAYPENIQRFIKHMPKLLPQAKIFALVREPVERAFSDYRRSIFKEELPPGTSFEQAITKSAALLERGRYKHVFQAVLSVIPKDSIKIFFYDDIRSQPDRFWRDMCGFLGISSEFIPSILHTQIHHLAPPKNPKIHALLRKVNRGVTNTAQIVGLSQLLLSLKRTSTWRKLVDMSVGQEGEISPVTRRKLGAYYAEDVAFLASFTGRDLSRWIIK